MSGPVPVTRWMLRRARLLHGICLVIERDRAKGMRAGRAYDKGRGRHNRSLLARQRGRHLCQSGMRAIYSRWRSLGRSAAAFTPSWKSSTLRKITAAQAIRWTRRVIAERITFRELYRRLRREHPDFTFSYSALCLNLPSRALRDVRQAHLALLRAERVALAAVARRTAGGAA